MSVTEAELTEAMGIGVEIERERIVAYLRRPNDDGTDCSVEREILAQRIERLEHLK